jgi:hypothetical protein
MYEEPNSYCMCIHPIASSFHSDSSDDLLTLCLVQCRRRTPFSSRLPQLRSALVRISFIRCNVRFARRESASSTRRRSTIFSMSSPGMRDVGAKRSSRYRLLADYDSVVVMRLHVVVSMRPDLIAHSVCLLTVHDCNCYGLLCFDREYCKRRFCEFL